MPCCMLQELRAVAAEAAEGARDAALGRLQSHVLLERQGEALEQLNVREKAGGGGGGAPAAVGCMSVS